MCCGDFKTVRSSLYLADSVMISVNALTFYQSDVNVVLVNWQKAARGKYARAVSNAELVGRLVGKTLISMVTMGSRPSDIHVIGFSLGAQVAGFIGETFKSSGLKLGRITGKCFTVLVLAFVILELCQKKKMSQRGHLKDLSLENTKYDFEKSKICCADVLF